MLPDSGASWPSTACHSCAPWTARRLASVAVRRPELLLTEMKNAELLQFVSLDLNTAGGE